MEAAPHYPLTLSRSFAQIAPWCGLIGPLVICLGMLISGLYYRGVEGQSYRLLNHFVSELGEVGVSRLSPAFNLSLILGGLLNMFFLIHLALQVQGWVRWPLLLLGVIGSTFGSLVGVFPMNNLEPHIFVALTFFDLGLLICLLYSLVILFNQNHTMPRWLALPGFLTTAAFLAFTNFPSDFEAGLDFQAGMAGLLHNRPDFIPLALMEWITILGIICWFLMLSGYMIANSPSGPELIPGNQEVEGP